MNDTALTDQASRLSGGKLVIALIPSLLLIAFAILNDGRVRRDQTTPWHSGSFGMHATLQSSPYRFARVYGIDAGDERHRLKLLWKPRMGNVSTLKPSPENSRKLLTRLDQQDTERFSVYEVEIWEYTYDRHKPLLGARFLVKHRLED